MHEQLVPPRILERFTSKKVKRGSSITFSVKVEGKVILWERQISPQGESGQHPTPEDSIHVWKGPIPGRDRPSS
jgi:hypothetical protein